MAEYRLFVITLLFVCVTAVKLCFPELRYALRADAHSLVCGRMDDAGLIQAMGSALADGDMKKVWAELEEDESLPVFLEKRS